MQAQEFKDHLVNDLIPFWNKMRDDENGGFYGRADEHGVIDKSAHKGVIYNSRILWFYSASYMLLKNEALLDNARHAFKFMVDHLIDPQYGGVFWSVTCDGEPREDLKHTYNQAFAIYALSAFYNASQDTSALHFAMDIYRTIEEKCKDEGGYLECFSREFDVIDNDKLSENGVMADRTMNTLLHILESYTELYKASSYYQVGDSLRDILRVFKKRIFNSRKKVCDVFFDHDYNSLIDLQSYGHDIETSWLMERACAALHDDGYLKEIKPMMDQMVKTTLITGMENGALCNECENGVIDHKKVWWVQAEAVTGFYNMYQHHPEMTEYRDTAESIWNTIKTVQIDKVTHEWIENIYDDAEKNKHQDLAHEWKGPYHNGRMCIEMIKRLEAV